MGKIKLLYVENVITRKQAQRQQRLSFFILVDNVSFDKCVDIVWSGEDGVWHTLSAQYHSMQGNDKEYWLADISLSCSEKRSLPGNIKFGVRYRVGGDEYWDNNLGHNYSSEADSGIKLAQNFQVQNIAFSHNLTEQQSSVLVTVAVDQLFNADKVTIHWTTNAWKTVEQTACSFNKDYWDDKEASNARNPNQYGIEIWSCVVESIDAFQLQYSICCESGENTLWDNNYGNNYSFQREQLKVLILNLHCYQEENQDEKFTKIAKVIDELQADIICFQEVAEYWRDGEGDWESNSAKIINDRLKNSFYLHTDWSHLGFDKYREGVAILSRYPLSNHQSQYVSESHDIYNIHSRKVIMAQVHIPYIGAVNVFSVHLSWLEDGFEQQFQSLHQWADKIQTKDTQATLLCGDFNITAGSRGYELVVNSNKYDDQFLAANQHGVFDQVFRVNDGHWHDLLAEDYRIDYVFMNKSSALQVTSARVVFTEQDYGQVSDHCGYFMTFEPKMSYSEYKEESHGNC